MVKKPRFKKMVWTLLGGITLVVIAWTFVSAPQKSINLPIGWQHKSFGFDCFDNEGNPFNGRSGWPFISARGGDCVSSVNHLASVINYSLLVTVVLVIMAYILYRIRSEREHV